MASPEPPTTTEATPPGDPDLGLLIIGGAVRVDSRLSDDGSRRVGETLGRLLQVRNLAVLLGAGASFHLGSPTIRSLTADDIRRLAADAGRALADEEDALLGSLVGDELVNLERLLETLSASLAYADAVQTSNVSLPGSLSPVATALFSSLRATLNAALANACDLPKRRETADAAPFHAHQEFFRRMLKSRRGDLPRVNVFTTNYDLVIERALDGIGITFVDGFVGTLDRSFGPRVYDHEIFLPGATDDRRLLRLEDMIYLYKIHGSINWRSGDSPESATASDSVVQVHPGERPSADDLALIYPTPHKELDVLGYPYAELFRALSDAVNEPETALLVVGYSFADEHINRILFQALSSNPTLQLFVVNPFGVLDLEECAPGASEASSLADGQELPPHTAFLDTRIARLAQAQDARVCVYTGPAATFEALAEHVMPDPDALSGEKDARAGEGALRSALVDSQPPPPG